MLCLKSSRLGRVGPYRHIRAMLSLEASPGWLDARGATGAPRSCPRLPHHPLRTSPIVSLGIRCGGFGDMSRMQGGELVRMAVVEASRLPDDDEVQGGERSETRPNRRTPTSREILDESVRQAKYRKATNIQVLSADRYPVMSALCEHVVVVTCRDRDQMLLVCRDLTRKFQSLRVSKTLQDGSISSVRPWIEAEESDRWMMVDLGQVVVHALSREGSVYYDIEGHWHDAQRAFEEDGTSHEEFVRKSNYKYSVDTK